MVKMMTASATVQQSRFGYDGDRAEKLDMMVTTGGTRNLRDDDRFPMEPSTCIFWCAVAIGALAQGRPVASVSHFLYVYAAYIKGWQLSFAQNCDISWLRSAPCVAATADKWCENRVPQRLLKQVGRYYQLAKDALASFSGPANAELAK